MNNRNNIIFDKSREAYNNMVIPSTLNSKVKEAVNMSAGRKHTNSRIIITVASTAAAIVILFIAGVNTSTAFAATLSDIPIIGSIVKVVTGRSFSEKNDNVTINVDIPQIDVDSTSASDAAHVTAEQVNAIIQKTVDDYMQEQQSVIDDYKKSFLETGGTIDEWNQRTIDLTARYEVKYQDDRCLSLYLYMYMSAFAFTQDNYYYNYDFATGRELTLKDILGDDYINIANRSIIDQITEQVNSDSNAMYWGYYPAGYSGTDTSENTDKFTTITDDTSFYLNSDGDPVICFPKYSIAPGYMGVREFVVKRQSNS